MDSILSETEKVAGGDKKYASVSDNFVEASVVHAFINDQSDSINIYVTRFGKIFKLNFEISAGDINEFHSLDLCKITNNEFLLVYSGRYMLSGEQQFPFRIRAQKFRVDQAMTNTITETIAYSDDFPFTNPTCSGLKSTQQEQYVAIVFETGNNYKRNSQTNQIIPGVGISLQVAKIQNNVMRMLFDSKKPYPVIIDESKKKGNQRQVTVASNLSKFVVSWAGDDGRLQNTVFLQGFNLEPIASAQQPFQGAQKVPDTFRIKQTQVMGYGQKPSIQGASGNFVIAFDKPLQDGSGIYPRMAVYDQDIATVCDLQSVAEDDGTDYSNVTVTMQPGGEKVQIMYSGSDRYHRRKFTIEGCSKESQLFFIENRYGTPIINFYGVQGAAINLVYITQEQGKLVYQFNEYLFYAATTGMCPANCQICLNQQSCGYCQGENPQERKLWMSPDGLCNCQSTGHDEKLFVDAGQTNCGRCMDQCQSCSGSADYCTSCEDQFKQTNDCLQCKIGYFQEPLSSQCKQCNPICKTCSQSSNKCQICAQGRDIQKACQSCLNNFYLEGNTCLECSQGCDDCDDAQSCNACKNPEMTTQSLCQKCIDGKYLDFDVCANCNADICQTCSEAPDNCLVCAIGRDDSDGCQSCLPNYYQQLGSSACVECPSLCSECTAVDVCQDCYSDGRNPQSACNSCLSNYFMNSTNECIACEIQCGSCRQSPDNCTTCKSTNQASYNPSTCLCKPGYFLDAQGICQVCDSSLCTECVGSADNCTDCVMGREKQSDPPCSACADGYLKEGSNCVECNPGCATCSQFGQCDSCKSAQNSTGQSPDCACSTGYFWKSLSGQPRNHTCQQCDAICSECSEASNSCTVCAIANKETPLCSECKQGYYWDTVDLACNKCNSLCKSCSGSADNCDICKAPQNRENAPDCGCNPTFFFLESITGQATCQACNPDCGSCENDANNCLTCKDINKKEPQCQECKSGYFLDGNCQQCDDLCQECENSATNCTVCYDDLLQGPDCIECIDRYFHDGENCQECLPDCSTCSNGQSCDTCSRQNSVEPDCDCKVGFYENSDFECEQCDDKCSSCESSSDNCIFCSINNAEAPSCECGAGTYIKEIQGQKSCIDCDSKCSKCDNITGNCISCSDQYMNPEQNCDSCLEQKYFDQSLQNCQKCPQYCVECEYSEETQGPVCSVCSANKLIPETQCKECEEGYLFDDQETYSCLACSEKYENCEKCTANGCSSCSTNYELSEETQLCVYRPQINYETAICDVSNINVVDKRCAECSFSNWQCTSCNKEQNRVLKNGICKCDIFFEEDPNSNNCREEQSFIKQETLKTTVKVAGATAGTAAATGLIFFNPGLLLSVLDTLQQIGYIKYLQIDYPILVTGYLEIFEMFDFDLFPNIVPEKKYHMDSRKGFSDQEVDALLFRNTSQYIILTLACFVTYVTFKSLQKFVFVKNGIPKKAVDKVLGFFEYQVLVGGMVGSYLNFTVFCYLQLLSSNVEDITQFSSLSIAYFVFIAEFILPFIILHVAKKYVLINKQVAQYQKRLISVENVNKEDKEQVQGSLIQNSRSLKHKIKKLNKEKEELDDKWGVLFEEFKQDNVLQAGYFALVGFRKIIFAFNLVVLNNFPYLNLAIFIILTGAEIFYFVKIQPQQFRYQQIRDIITQLSFLVIYGASYPFLDENLSDELRINCSITIIVAVTIILAAEFLFLIMDYFVAMYEFIKGLLQKKDQKSGKIEQKSSDGSYSDESQSQSDDLSSKNMDDMSKLTQSKQVKNNSDSQYQLSAQNSFDVFQSHQAELSEVVLS